MDCFGTTKAKHVGDNIGGIGAAATGGGIGNIGAAGTITVTA